MASLHLYPCEPTGWSSRGRLSNDNNVESVAGEGGSSGGSAPWDTRTLLAPADLIIAGKTIVVAVVIAVAIVVVSIIVLVDCYIPPLMLLTIVVPRLQCWTQTMLLSCSKMYTVWLCYYA